MLVDSHVNLHSEKYDDDLPTVIDRAREAGVDVMLTISDRLSSELAIRAIADADDNIWRTVGVHPHYARDYKNLTAETLVQLAKDIKVVGIGECGLDYYYEHSDRGVQEQVFAAHVEAAAETKLPLIIHTRDADEEMQQTLQEAYKRQSYTPLLHCYTGGPALAQAVLDMGGYISFSGIITFKNAQDIRDIAAATPHDRIIIETDCPYLAPVPMRGRRNEPAYVVHVAEKLAEVLGVPLEEVERLTTNNFFHLFSQARDPRESK